MYTSQKESDKDLKKANAPHKIEIRERKAKMAKRMPSREREILEKAYIKSFGKPMPKHLKKDYPNIK